MIKPNRLHRITTVTTTLTLLLILGVIGVTVWFVMGALIREDSSQRLAEADLRTDRIDIKMLERVEVALAAKMSSPRLDKSSLRNVFSTYLQPEIKTPPPNEIPPIVTPAPEPSADPPAPPVQ